MELKLKKNFITITLVIIFIGLIGFSIGYFGYNFYKNSLNNDDYKNNSYLYFAKDNPDVLKIIEENKKLNITQYIYNECLEEESNAQRMYCTNNYVLSHYKFRKTEEIVYTIDEMFEKGADCKSYSFYYATFAVMFGLDYNFILLGDHVVTIVAFKEGYCILDQKIAECFSYGNLE